MAKPKFDISWIPDKDHINGSDDFPERLIYNHYKMKLIAQGIEQGLLALTLYEWSGEPKPILESKMHSLALEIGLVPVSAGGRVQGV